MSNNNNSTGSFTVEEQDPNKGDGMVVEETMSANVQKKENSKRASPVTTPNSVRNEVSALPQSDSSDITAVSEPLKSTVPIRPAANDLSIQQGTNSTEPVLKLPALPLANSSKDQTEAWPSSCTINTGDTKPNTTKVSLAISTPSIHIGLSSLAAVPTSPGLMSSTTLPNDIIQTEVTSSATIPTGIMQTGVTSDATIPTGIIQTGVTASAAIPAGFIQTGLTSCTTIPTGIIQSGVTSSAAIPTGVTLNATIPSGTFQTGIPSSAAIPAGIIQSGVASSATIPTGVTSNVTIPIAPGIIQAGITSNGTIPISPGIVQTGVTSNAAIPTGIIQTGMTSNATIPISPGIIQSGIIQSGIPQLGTNIAPGTVSFANSMVSPAVSQSCVGLPAGLTLTSAAPGVGATSSVLSGINLVSTSGTAGTLLTPTPGGALNLTSTSAGANNPPPPSPGVASVGPPFAGAINLTIANGKNQPFLVFVKWFHDLMRRTSCIMIHH